MLKRMAIKRLAAKNVTDVVAGIKALALELQTEVHMLALRQDDGLRYFAAYESEAGPVSLDELKHVATCYWTPDEVGSMEVPTPGPVKLKWITNV